MPTSQPLLYGHRVLTIPKVVRRAGKVRVSDTRVRVISSDGPADYAPQVLRDGYLNLQDQSSGAGVLDPEPRPELGPGTHFAYGLQWWFFGALALTGSLRPVADSSTTSKEQHEFQSSR